MAVNLASLFGNANPAALGITNPSAYGISSPAPTPPPAPVNIAPPPAAAPAPSAAAPSYSAPAPSYSAPAPTYTPPPAAPAPVSQPSFTHQKDLEIAATLGYTGGDQGATGEIRRWLSTASPAVQKQYENMRRAAGDSSYLLTGENTNLQDFNSGVKPLTVASLTDWQKQALEALSKSVTSGNQYYDIAAQLLSGVQPLINNATKPLTGDDFQKLLEQYSNPYTAQVRDQTISTINQEGEKARARILAANARDPGSSSTGVQMAELDKSIAKAIADAAAGINFQGFQNAAEFATGQSQNQQKINLAGASALSALPGIAVSLGDVARRNTLADITNQLTAGTFVQDQNQRLLDAVRGELDAKRGYTDSQLSNYAGLIQALSGLFGSASSSSPSQPNNASRISDLLQAGGGLLGSYGSGYGNALSGSYSAANAASSGAYNAGAAAVAKALSTVR